MVRTTTSGLKIGDRIRIRFSDGKEIQTSIHMMSEPGSVHQVTYIDRNGKEQIVDANQVKRIVS